MSACPACDAAIAADQRYCVSCGVRLEHGADPVAAGAPPAATGVGAATPVRGAVGWTIRSPTPRAAAALALGFLGLGSIVGASANPGRSVAGSPPVVFASGPPVAVAPAVPAPVAPPAIADTGVDDADVGSEVTDDTAVDPVVAEDVPVVEEDPAVGTDPGEDEPAPDPDPAEGPVAKPVNHIWMVVLAQTSFDAAYGPESQLPSLAKTGTAKGTLLTQMYSVSRGSLAAGVALLSGQGPTPAIQDDCPTYTDITPGTVDADGQAQGDGCVFPAQVSTLFDQLRANGFSWRVYAQDGEKTGPPGPTPPTPTATCRRPQLGQADPWQAPRPGDAYLTPRNPAVYFRAVVDVPECAKQVVGLDALDADLKLPAKKAPAFSYVVPNGCVDGRPAACEVGKPAGPAAAEPAVAYLLRQIKRSAAYKDGGLIIVTSDQGAPDDNAGCCRTEPFPNLPADKLVDGQPTGGGRVGALLLSQDVRRGYVDDTRLDHFSLLRLVEDKLELPPLGYAADVPVVPPEVFLPE